MDEISDDAGIERKPRKRERAAMSPPPVVLAVDLNVAPHVVGVTLSRIDEALREKTLTARKSGKNTIIEIEELQRWVRALPVRGREPESLVA